jgi:O-methyltransferase
VRITGAADVLELGTYTGYSALCMARALPADGHLVTCDITDRWPSIGVP